MTPTENIYNDSIVPDSVFSFVTETEPMTDTVDEGFAFCLDSIFRLRDTVEPIRRTSVFHGHELVSHHNALIPRLADGGNMWIFAFILAVLILLTIVLRTRRVKVSTLMQAGIFQRKMDILMREGSFTRFSTFFHSVLFFSFIAATLPYYLLRGQLDIAIPPTLNNGIIIYATMAITLVVAILLRQGVTLWLGNVFNSKEPIRYYLGNTQIFLLIDTIVLLPFSLLLFFSPLDSELAPIALTIAALLVIIRIIRGMFVILSTTNDSKFYLFYYLCTVEIVPILIIAKTVFG